jgi:hypothetical protein
MKMCSFQSANILTKKGGLLCKDVNLPPLPYYASSQLSNFQVVDHAPRLTTLDPTLDPALTIGTIFTVGTMLVSGFYLHCRNHAGIWFLCTL